jgi:hypothetical protein
MVWYIKKNSENKENVFVNYSCENNKNCDGLIKYNRNTESFEIEELSKGSGDFEAKRLFPLLYKFIDKNNLPIETYRLAIG